MRLFHFIHMSLAAVAFGDSLTIKKCNCATDMLISYQESYKINGDSTGLPEDKREMWYSGSYERDDLLFPQKQGMLCTPEHPKCRRVPSMSQYVSWEDMTPRVATDACVRKGDDQEFCAAFSSIKVGHEWKFIPDSKDSWHYIGNDECEDYCKSLWPVDNTTFPLCEHTERRPDHPRYGSLYFSGNGYYSHEADACWEYNSHQWDWKKLKNDLGKPRKSSGNKARYSPLNHFQGHKLVILISSYVALYLL